MAMSNAAQAIIKIEPENELVFRGTFKEPISAVMNVSNLTGRKVCFKVRTTVPQRYIVNPAVGVVDPHSETKILISLQPLDPDSVKGKHKFQILSAYAPDIDFEINQFWKNNTEDTIHQCKFVCVLDRVEESVVAVEPAPEADAMVDVPAPAPELEDEIWMVAPVLEKDAHATVDAPTPAPDLEDEVRMVAPVLEKDAHATVDAPAPAPELKDHEVVRKVDSVEMDLPRGLPSDVDFLQKQVSFLREVNLDLMAQLEQLRPKDWYPSMSQANKIFVIVLIIVLLLGLYYLIIIT